MNIEWDAKGYDKNFGFVPGYGAAVADLLEAVPGASCLDLGCGNGTLTAELAARGLDVTGMDASPQMLALARANHPDLRFVEGDATSFSLERPVDAVFSNAVLHWIDAKKQSAALAHVAAALVPGGEFVFEMGGHACGARTHKALSGVFAAHGLTYKMPFFFPTVGEYAPLVEAAGLRVTYAALFDRPTALAGPDGMADWIHMFVRRPFEGVEPELAEQIITEAVDTLREDPVLWHDGTWYADYTRLRMRAVKAM